MATAATSRSQRPAQNRIRTGSFRRCGILVSNEVAMVKDPSPLVAPRRISSGGKIALPDRSTRPSPLIVTGRDDEWNDKKKTTTTRSDTERRNRPDDQRRPTERRCGPTNPIAVTKPVASSRIPRLTNNVVTRHPAAASNGSPDSSGMADSSLDLSPIGRNRSSNSSQSSSSSGLVVPGKPSRLLPPGSIVSAKLAAAQQVGRRSRVITAPPTSVHQRAAIKSKLPVAQVTKRPDCRSTRSLPDGSVRSTTTVIARSAQLHHLNGARIVHHKNASVAAKPLLLPHKTPDRGTASKKKADAAAGLKEKKEEGGPLECRPVSAGGEGEICRGPQGRPEEEEEGSLSADPTITPPPPVPAGLPDEVDGHLDAADSHSADTSATTSGLLVASTSSSNGTRPVSVHESSSIMSEWTVRINIAAAESSELLTRLECERQSIRGSASYLTAPPPVAADVELMELLERDLLLTENDQEIEEETTPVVDDSVESSNPQRSLSLPKSFLATRYGLIGLKAALPSVRFPWRRTEGNRVTTSTQHHAETSSAAPHTSLPPTGPSVAVLTAAARRPPGSAASRTARRFKSTSSPVFIDDDDRVNRSHSAWDLASRPWSHFGEMSVSGSQSELAETISVASITNEQAQTDAPTSNNSTLRKFRKSFSLRLSRRPSQDDTNNEEEQDGESSLEQTSPKFRFGPLVWRASRERASKKGATNKAARNAKCNSGDSGVQMETTADETDNVRRTQSDLGGEAVIAAALRSNPLPDKNRSRKLTRTLAKAHLRRSASQPVVVAGGMRAADGPSDEDAGLCLSEDDNLSEDCNGNKHPQAENEAVRYSAATEGVVAIALWDHNAVEQEELSLQSGDVVHILDLSDPNWWWAAKGQHYGWLPASYVQLCEQPFHRKQGLAQGQKFARTLTPAGMAALQHSVRANVINELVTAERDYVKLLSDLVDGYLKPMKSRPDLFSQQRIQSIFGNLEELYRFQKSFLVDLEHSLNWNALEDSVVGGCFLQHIQEFAIYATYCNNQDRAAAEMQLLCDDMRYLRFFEACRLLRRMIRLPLEAFLLSPVQKICKYPLQLAELLKHTPDEHPDRRLVSLALDSMRSVAYLVNESKRRAEMQQFLVHWQSGVDHWMGSDITTFNSRLVHQGELFKISSNGWTREVTLFLFDKELVICKKELIKRSCLVYKDRLTVEDVEVLEPLAVVDVRPHSFQLRSFSRAKAYLLACRSAQDKNQWVSAIQHLQQHNSADWPIFPAPTMSFGRQKMSNKRSKVKQNPALILTLEEAHLTLEGRDMPTVKTRKS